MATFEKKVANGLEKIQKIISNSKILKRVV